MGAGSTIGSLLGGAAGSFLLPGVGTAIGSSLGGAIGGQIDKKGSSSGGGGQSGAGGTGLSLATGLLQGIQANKLKRQADAVFPELVDPNQASYLAELNQKRKSIDTGADAAEAFQEANQNQASANDAIVKASGGDSGSAIQGLLQAQGVAGATKNKALADGQNQQFAYTGAYGNQLNMIAAKKLQLQLLKQNQLMARFAAKQQAAGQNTQAGLGRLLSGTQPSEAQGQSAQFANGLTVDQMSQMTPDIGNDVQETSAPSIVPQNNLAIQSLGTPITLAQ